MKADYRVTVNEEKTTLYPANSSYIVNRETSGNTVGNTGAYIGDDAGVNYYNSGNTEGSDYWSVTWIQNTGKRAGGMKLTSEDSTTYTVTEQFFGDLWIDGKTDLRDLVIAVKCASGTVTGKESIGADAKNDDLYITSLQFTGTLEQAEAAPHKIVYLGDSITSGVGTYPDGSEELATYGKTHSYFGYANRTADKLNADYYSVSNGGWGLGYTKSPYYSIRKIYDKVSIGMLEAVRRLLAERNTLFETMEWL